MLALAGIAAMFCRYRDDPAAANPAILLLSLRGLFPPRERLWWSRTASLVGLLPVEAALSFILSTSDASAHRYRSDRLEVFVPLLALQRLATRIPENRRECHL